MDEKAQNGRPVLYWDCAVDAEILLYETKNKAIEAFLDNLVIDPAELGRTIKVYGYGRMIAPKPTMEDAIDLVEEYFELHWEEMQSEDGPNAPSSTYDAALTFLTVLHKDFIPWACEQTTSEEVNVAGWIKANRPDWLKSKYPT